MKQLSDVCLLSTVAVSLVISFYYYPNASYFNLMIEDQPICYSTQNYTIPRIVLLHSSEHQTINIIFFSDIVCDLFP